MVLLGVKRSVAWMPQGAGEERSGGNKNDGTLQGVVGGTEPYVITHPSPPVIRR
jgi:hypothetical protein